MKKRRLAATDLEVSEICLGTMTWGEQNSEAEAHAQLDLAVERGIDFIDTAEMYPAPPRGETQGRTETYLGSWLAKRRRREGLVIASKVAGPGRRDWIRGGRTDLTADNIVEACQTSLQRLGIAHLDLYQIHWPQRNVPMFGQAAFDPAAEKNGGPSIREQVSLLAYSPLAGGMLTGKYRGGAKPEGARFTRFDNFGVRFRRPGVAEAVDAYLGIAQQRGLTPVQVAIGWLRSRWFVGSIIVGATSVGQLEECIAASQVDLDRETLAEIEAVQLRYPNPAP